MTKANFNKFDDVNHVPLRVFNRVVLMSNLMGDFGKDVAISYAELFEEGERKQMYIMQSFISQQGLEAARATVTKGLVFAETPSE